MLPTRLMLQVTRVAWDLLLRVAGDRREIVAVKWQIRFFSKN